MTRSRKTRPSRSGGHVDAHVGQQLRKLREARDLSQDGLAQQVKLTFQQIQKYERATNRVSASRLFEFSQVLGVKVEYFFEGLSSEKHDAQRALADMALLLAFATSKHGSKLLEAFAEIADAHQRRALLRLIRVLAPHEER